MEIIVEIGDDNIKSLILQELEYFVSFFDIFPTALNISKIIVPLDFAGKVNELEGRTDYTGKHGIDAAAVGVAAKNIIVGNDRIILLSQLLYVEIFDSMVRCFIFFHEISHVVNAIRFPKISDQSFSLQNYLGNLYYLYDEYFSDRLAYSISEKMFKSPSEIWENYIHGSVENYLSTANDVLYYEQICQEIESFRSHADVDLFLNQIHDSMSVVTITTIHAFARYHQVQETMKDFVIPLSKFVNDKTLKLMDYFKSKFENRNFDLMDGVDLITEYWTNFGVKFEDRPEGGYVYVIDI